jgi:hypothetical protein
MTKSTKAALLSAFVFPGAGHFFLKKHVAGVVLAVSAFASLYMIISNMVERALQLTDKILSGEVPLDVATITELLAKQPPGAEAQLLNIAWVVLIISWLLGIVDSYRIGLGQEN